MMNLNFSVGLSICIALQGIMLLLYFYDPDIFISRYLIRISKIKFFLRSSFGKSGKAHKEKWHKLRTTIECCEEAISKYVNKKNLSTLQDDETLKNLLIVYRELLDMNESADSELSLEMIQEAKYKVEDLYLPAMDPYYEYDMEDAI